MLSRVLVAAAALVGGASAAVDVNSPAMNPKIIDEVNSNPASTWKAGHNAYFDNWDLGMVVRSMGARKNTLELPTLEYPSRVHAALPDNFDWTVANPTCVAEDNVSDQGRCGSCWAQSSTMATADRLCLASNATANVVMSSLNLVTCDQYDDGCQGGQPSDALNYFMSTGVPTYSCMPYLKADGGPIPTCAPADQPCMPPTFVPTPSCVDTCLDGSAPKFTTISNAYYLQSLADIQADLVKNGPVVAAFTVYSDFVHYKSGIYTVSPSASPLGGHAVEIVGYGVEGSVSYFRVRNSWTSTWGDNGYFKIAVDQCGIADDVVAGI